MWCGVGFGFPSSEVALVSKDIKGLSLDKSKKINMS